MRTIVAAALALALGWLALARFIPRGEPAASVAACDDASFVRLMHAHPSGYTEVNVCGTVTRVSRERRTRSGRHRSFYVRVDAAGDAVEIVTNVDETGDFAVAVGDSVEVRGRYYDDPDGAQGIDWTHRTDARASWPYSGYVRINGGAPIE